jgi:hypothetical protein
MYFNAMPPLPIQKAPLSPTPQFDVKPLFQFYLDKCVITNTRSIHQDTLVGALGVLLTKGTSVSAPYVITAKLGDHNNTTFAFWEKGLGSLDNIGIDADTQVTFLYELYNNGAKGHPNPDELKQEIGDHLKLQAALNALQNSNPQLAAALVNAQQLSQLQQHMSTLSASSISLADIFSGGLYGAFYSLIDGCDGIVAAGTYGATGTLLSERIASSPNQVISQTDTSNGKQNGWGAPCNPHGSNYLISWIAQARGQGLPSVSV